MIDFPKFTKADDKPAPRWFHVAVAVAMLLGALASLVGTLRTSATMRELVEQNARLVRANSTPLLMFGHGNLGENGTPRLTFSVTNAGTGPARVAWFELRVDGKPAKDMVEAVRSVAETVPGELRFNSSRIAPQILLPRDTVKIFAWDRPAETDPQLDAWKKVERARFKAIEVEACFCSVFEQCWQSKLNADVPVTVEKCDPAGRTSLRG